LNFDYLSVAGYKAVFSGSGKIIGGISGVNFIMYVIDGALDGTGIDKVRLKIYNKNTNEIYYDNERGKSDAADPTTPVGLNSTVIISGTASSITKNARSADQSQPQVLQLAASPNPSKTEFAIKTISSDKTNEIVLQLFDIYGRLIEARKTTAGSTITLGSQLRPGSYYVKAIQGDQHSEMKLVKLSD